MPKEKEVTNHPCHLLSLPSAKRFWCRHCMTVFEDAITRWRHSRSCRYGVVNNFMRRRELEAKALQNTTILNPVEARLEQSIQMCDLAASTIPTELDPNVQPQILPGPESFTCFICHQKFSSMEEMRAHVKDPCSNNKIITSRVPHPKHSVPVFIDAFPVRIRPWQTSPPVQQQEVEIPQAAAYGQTHSQQPAQASYDIEIQSEPSIEPPYDSSAVTYVHGGNNSSDSITPTNIYVNEQGETVIEVENLDLNTEGGELSLAHLLTQLSQQGIVFDKTGSAHLQSKPEVVAGASPSTALYSSRSVYEPGSGETYRVDDDESQPTAEDAANTLAQLAGFRSFTRLNQKSPQELQHSHTQVGMVEGYSYETSPGSSQQYTVQPQTDLKYQYQYSNSSAGSGHTIVAAQQAAFQQVVASQDYENVKVEEEVSDEGIHFYDTTSVTYITEEATDQHLQVDPNTNVSSEESQAVCAEDGQPVLVQHYSVDVDESGQLINMSVQLPGQELTETGAALISAEPAGNGKTSEIAVTEACGSEHNPEQHQIVEARNLVQESVETDEFTIQTVSLQEIVDSDSNALSFGGQSDRESQIEINMIEPTAVSTNTTLLEQSDSSTTECLQPLEEEEEEGGMQCPKAETQEGNRPPFPTALFVVSSAGIVPISNKSA